MNIRATPDHSSYMTIISQYTEGNHYNAVNRELLVLATLLVLIFRVIVPLLPSDLQNKIFQNKFAKTT